MRAHEYTHTQTPNGHTHTHQMRARISNAGQVSGVPQLTHYAPSKKPYIPSKATYWYPKSPTFMSKSPVYIQKSPTHVPNNHIFHQMSPICQRAIYSIKRAPCAKEPCIPSNEPYIERLGARPNYYTYRVLLYNPRSKNWCKTRPFREISSRRKGLE